MQLSREERLEYCTKCLKRTFIPNKGVCCSITNERATFNNKCIDYSPDKDLIEGREYREAIRKELDARADTHGLYKFGIRSKYAAEILIISLCTFWFSIGYFQFNLIFFKPIIIISGVGLIIILRLIFQFKQRKKEDNNQDILDN